MGNNKRLKNRTFTLIVKANVTPGTNLTFSSSEIWIKTIWFQAKRIDGDNTGPVYVGDSNVHKTNSRQMKLNPGDYWSPPIPMDTVMDLATWFLDADNATDGIVGGYFEETNL